MPQHAQIFVNLPIKDMARSQAFFRSLGYEFNPQFTNEQGACMVVSPDHNYVMLLVESFFSTFTKKPIADATSILQPSPRSSCRNPVQPCVIASCSCDMRPPDRGARNNDSQRRDRSHRPPAPCCSEFPKSLSNGIRSAGRGFGIWFR